MRYSRSAITLIEIMISMLIVSFVMVSAFQVLSYVWIAKIKLIEKSQIEKEAFFASERLIDLIKKWGSIDYEEYWNRRAIGNVSFSWWHFSVPSWFWNQWDIYYCLSDNGTSMGAWWCLTWFNRTIASTASLDYTWAQQRYRQYRLQYIDHNSDANDDFWDISRTVPNYTNFIWDDDDLFLWKGPDTFIAWSDAWELYLINASWDERTYFRWKVWLDPEAPITETCMPWVGKAMTGSWCLWTIQILKLQWVDTNGDGSVNEWIIHPDYVSDGSRIIAWSIDMNPYWQNIFSNRIHVSRAEFYLYPNQNLDYAWSDSRDDLQLAPYLQLSITLEPSWKERRRLRWNIPVVSIATTVSLSQIDIF